MKMFSDAALTQNRTYISQGEFAVLADPQKVIRTLLGSCVSACLWDANAAVGGMNHVVFVDEDQNASDLFGHGVNGMELLINELLKQGAKREHLKAKVFGGANLQGRTSDVGARNGEFVLDFLNRERISYVGGDIGGRYARQLEFHPVSGRARQKLVMDHLPKVKAPPPPQDASNVELF